MTVSVVINGTGSNTRVSDNTRSRILAAAERLRYRPNAYARGLSRRRMDTIGVAAVVDGFEINVYFLELLNGILEAATELGQNTIVFSVKGWNPESLNVTQFCDGRADGIIFIAPTLTQEFAEALQARHLPFVTIHNGSTLPGVLNLDVANESGACDIVRYLISQGHRRILHLPGEMSVIGTEHRLEGYRRALTEAGLPVDDSLIVPGHYSVASGVQRMREILSQGTQTPLPTAIFCGSDAIALGCVEVLTERGIRVPDDISVAGFDDTLNARSAVPPLTTVRQPFRKMGRAAAERLVQAIKASRGEADQTPFSQETTLQQEVSAGQSSAPSQQTTCSEIYSLELVVRGSVGPPPSNSIYLIPQLGK
jgi:LacI family transcriptional regulator